jgi:phage-related baseplate assembly protein
MAYELTGKKKNKEVRYLNKDFSQFRNNLIEFSKQYFPNTYQDFNESSPGMMFIEMASYVGDVMSYYVDSQFKESLLGYSEELRTLYAMAQLVPATGEGNNIAPDYDYALNIKAGTRVETSDGVVFRTIEDCDMRYESSRSPREVEIFERDSSSDTPTYYYIRKEVRAQSGNITDEDFTFGGAKKYDKVLLSNSNVIDIISCTDSDGNTWYEVDSLAQDTVFDEYENNSDNDPELSQYSSEVPYILRLKRVSKRFTTFRRPDGKTELRFGAGISDNADEEIIPNPNNVGSNLPGSPSKLYETFDPSNFLKTKTYGQAPSNTTLTINYQYGGGAQDNVAAGRINKITGITFEIDESNLTPSVVNFAKTSVRASNIEASSGGMGAESVEELRENIKAYFQSQNRAVTKDDYIVRTYALPDKYGNIAKAYITQDTIVDENQDDPQPNPLALNLYILGLNTNNHLVNVNDAVKENLKTYLTRFRPVTDAVNIKNAYVINIGVDCTILTKNGYDQQLVITNVNQRIAEYFDVDRWQINQPIILSELQNAITSDVEGVLSVTDITITNQDTYSSTAGYSGNRYNIASALKNGIVYPAKDPSIFEVKFPNNDISTAVDGGEG